jgi:hypothetical protein
MPKYTIRRSDKKRTKSVKSKPSSSNTRKLVPCYCDKCNGEKVDSRMRIKHQLKLATQPASKKHKVLIVFKKPEIDSSSSSSSSASSLNDNKEGIKKQRKLEQDMINFIV